MEFCLDMRQLAVAVQCRPSYDNKVLQLSSSVTVIYGHVRSPCCGATWRFLWSGKSVKFYRYRLLQFGSCSSKYNNAQALALTY